MIYGEEEFGMRYSEASTAIQAYGSIDGEPGVEEASTLVSRQLEEAGERISPAEPARTFADRLSRVLVVENRLRADERAALDRGEPAPVVAQLPNRLGHTTLLALDRYVQDTRFELAVMLGDADEGYVTEMAFRLATGVRARFMADEMRPHFLPPARS